MRTLALKARRDAKTMRLRGFAIVIAVAFKVAINGGYHMSLVSAKHSFDKICHDLHLADLQVFIETPSAEEELPSFDDVPGIEAISKRLFSRGTIELRTGENLAACIIHDEHLGTMTINRLRILKGSNLSPEDSRSEPRGVLLDRTMESVHGFKVGDTFTLTQYGVEVEKEVKGIVLSPEFIFPSVDPSVVLPAKGSLALIFTTMSDISELFGHPLYNSISFKFDRQHDPQEIEERILEKLSNVRIKALIPQRESFDQKVQMSALKAAPKFGSIVNIVLMVVVFIIIYVNIYRMIEEKKHETGVFIALGGAKKDMVLFFLKINLSYICLGFVFGYGASFLLNPILTMSYIKSQIDLPEIRTVFLPVLPLRSISLAAIPGLLALLCGLLQFRSLSPHEWIRGESPAARALPSWAFGSHGRSRVLGNSMILRYAFRGMVRRRNLTIVTVVSISATLALTVSYNILFTSLDRTMINFFDRDGWKVILDFRTPLDRSEIYRALPDGVIGAFEGYVKGLGVIQTDDQKRFGQIFGLEAGGTMKRIDPLEGKGFTHNNAFEVILNRKLWEKGALHIGQKIPIQTSVGSYTMELVGLVEEVTWGVEYMYLPMGTAQEILDLKGKYMGILAVSTSSPEDLKRILSKNEAISTVTPKKDIDRIITQSVAGVKASIIGILLVNMLAVPIFLFTSMGLSIVEKERDFVVLRSMGARGREILKILMTEALLVGVIGTLVSIPLAFMFGMMQAKMGSRIWHHIETYVRVSDYTYILVCLPLFPIVAWFFSARISRLNIVQKLMKRMG